ncbi:MAG TPA: integration host factor subunit beta, partial [Spirochaetia bacterium]|nr:integration host factor subunit beta [Spirochaetia bacterium]
MASKLTRAELIELISEKFPLKKTEANLLLEMVFKAIKQALADKRAVELRGFGTFEIHRRARRKARNPKTGEKLMTEPYDAVFFRPGREMRNLVKNSSIPENPES